jgi:Ca2+-binding RTX toxin-like protein
LPQGGAYAENSTMHQSARDLETLEDRTLLSSAINKDKHLVIRGDNGASNVCVIALDSAKKFLFVNLNGTEFKFKKDNVDLIDYVGGDGPDFFQVDQTQAKLGIKVRFQGNAGNDTFIGGNEKDEVFGDDGNDTLMTGNGDDTVEGGAGDDLIICGNDAKLIFGDAGNDTITTGNGRGYIFGGDGNDVITTGGDHFEILGNDGNDTLTGHGRDTLWGGGGIDVLKGGVEQHGGEIDRINKLIEVLTPERPSVH